MLYGPSSNRKVPCEMNLVFYHRSIMLRGYGEDDGLE